MSFVETFELRARFAKALSGMYGEEVPAYNTLVEVSEEVNRDFMEKMGSEAERLGTLGRVTAERHGAIRVGSATEMRQVARLFRGFGMHPVGFYDLRDAAKSSVPVVSTAFRPVDREELAKNPFRVFTSMLTTNDPRFFSAELQQRLEEFIGSRNIFNEELLELADKAAEQRGLEAENADRFVELATAAFKLNDEPIDDEWYRMLEKISAVAADIGGVRYTHINHLTPRVLDIDALYERMEARGITMIDEIQGPPAWDGPDVLLRQTSFRALDEERVFRFADGTVGPGSLRVRFGEVEQRGIALTPQGRELYDEMVAETDARLQANGGVRTEVARGVWQERLPDSEKELRKRGLAYFTYELTTSASESGSVQNLEDREYSVDELIEAGIVEATPIVYEDFLPRSAAGIFQSNLKDDGTRDNEQEGTDYDIRALSEIVGEDIQEPYFYYSVQERESLQALAEAIGRPVATTAAVQQ